MRILEVSNFTQEPYISDCIHKLWNQAEYIVCSVDDILVNHLQLNNRMDFNIILIWLRVEKTNQEIAFLDRDQYEKYIQLKRSLINELQKKLSMFNYEKIIWISYENFNTSYKNYIGNIYTNSDMTVTLNNILNEIKSETNIILDLQSIIASLGARFSYSNLDYYRWGNPYSKALIDEVLNQVYKTYLISTKKSKKCLVVDCDNVLWGGIVSEDGMDRLIIGDTGKGLIYKEFQLVVRDLYHKGIIICLCSKNNPEDVFHVFDNHKAMVLSRKEITIFQISWDTKADALKSISKELNIGLDSIVFIDDMDYELEIVKKLIPEVVCSKFSDKNIDYEFLNLFNVSDYNDKDMINIRNQTYASNKKRKEVLIQESSYEKYIELLNTELTLEVTTSSELNRISELSYRVNKCTNGKRYSFLELKDKLENKEYKLLSIYIKDAFGDLGLVGAVGISKQEHLNNLDLFCISCRALGRNVENKILKIIGSKYNINTWTFHATKSNLWIEQLLIANLSGVIHYD